MGIDNPSIETHHAASNLPKIIQEASGEQIIARQQMVQVEEARRKELGAAEDARKTGGGDSAGMDVAMGLASEALGLRAVSDAITFINDRRTSFTPSASLKKSMGGFISDAAQSADDFTLGQRAKIASKALTGEVEATAETEKPKMTTETVKGLDSEMVAARALVHQQKLETALNLQHQYQQDHGISQPRLGGMAPGMGMAPSMSLARGPKGPTHVNNKPADDGAFDYAGNAGA